MTTITLPDLIADFEAADGAAAALAWLEDNDVGPLPIPAKLLLAVEIGGWKHGDDEDVPFYRFVPGEPNVLAFPILRGGEAIDLMIINLDDMDYQTVGGVANWLGEDNLDSDVVRLHFSPLEWLEAGCTGVCNIHPYQRRHMVALQRAKRIVCNSVELALEAWEWGFSAHEEDIERFECDDHPENIRAYFDRQVVDRARYKLALH